MLLCETKTMRTGNPLERWVGTASLFFYNNSIVTSHTSNGFTSWTMKLARTKYSAHCPSLLRYKTTYKKGRGLFSAGPKKRSISGQNNFNRNNLLFTRSPKDYSRCHLYRWQSCVTIWNSSTPAPLRGTPINCALRDSSSATTILAVCLRNSTSRSRGGKLSK